MYDMNNIKKQARIAPDATRLWCKRQKRGIFPANSPFAEANSDAEHG